VGRNKLMVLYPNVNRNIWIGSNGFRIYWTIFNKSCLIHCRNHFVSYFFV